MLNTLQSSPIRPPAICSNSWSPSSFCCILWFLFAARKWWCSHIPGQEHNLHFLSHLLDTIHHEISLSFICNFSFAPALADLRFVPCFLTSRDPGTTASFTHYITHHLPILCITNPTSNIDNHSVLDNLALTPFRVWTCERWFSPQKLCTGHCRIMNNIFTLWKFQKFCLKIPFNLIWCSVCFAFKLTIKSFVIMLASQHS